MSGRMKWFVPMVMTMIAALAGAVLTSSAAEESANMLGFTIRFKGVEYDANLDQSTWYYEVEVSPSAPHDLSHWDLALCAPGLVVAEAGGRYKTSHPMWTEVGRNPHTSIMGIKFDVEVDKGETEEFWFVLQGNWEIGEVEVGAKGGRFVEVRTIQGPSCAPVICKVQYSVEYGRIDFRVLQPGTYASLFGEIHLSGNSGATLFFENFDHAAYLSNPAGPPIELRFGFGRSLDEVDASGWISAEELNNRELNFSASEIKGGVELTIWIRLLVEEIHSSSDYEVSGKIGILAECPR